MSEQKRSPWVWIGCGCVGCLGLVAVGFVILFFLSSRAVRDIGEGFTDPEAREEKVLDLLQTDTLPSGYHAFGGFSVPLFMSLAMITDADPAQAADPEHPALGERLLVYVRGARWLTQGADTDIFDRMQVSIDQEERLGSGTLEMPTMTIDYTAFRGNVEIQGERRNGILAMMQIGCSADSRLRMAIWMAPDPAVEEEVSDLRHTPADEAEIRDFMSHFDFCAG